MLEREKRECVERGYLLLPVVLQHVATGDWETAYDAAAEAVAIGERYGDRDLFSLAVHEQGRALIQQGRVEEGLGLLDEAMVVVTAGELSPIVTGLVYCSVIDICQGAYEPHRDWEWTNALTRWCEQQPDMVAFTGRCLVHRPEIMQLHGAWPLETIDGVLQEHPGTVVVASSSLQHVLGEIGRGVQRRRINQSADLTQSRESRGCLIELATRYAATDE